MSITIRLEEEKDYRNVEHMTREAFWNVYKPGCDEHLMVHKIRKVPAFIKELSYVACDKDQIVGSIIYSKAKVVNEENKEFEVLCMGPIGVLPSYQGKGIGSLLMNYTIESAKELGYKAIIIFGSPEYYHRFGFVNAKEFEIKTRTGKNFDAFMALELCNGGLEGITGRYYEDPVFEIEAAELEIFDRAFPYKEKRS